MSLYWASTTAANAGSRNRVACDGAASWLAHPAEAL